MVPKAISGGGAMPEIFSIIKAAIEKKTGLIQYTANNAHNIEAKAIGNFDRVNLLCACVPTNCNSTAISLWAHLVCWA